MKKIDLHIHTTKSISDIEVSNSDFDIELMKSYILNQKIDCIAITNHNLFRLDQFKEIKTNIEIKVLPGIEINLEGGHILLISECDELEDFNLRCNLVEKKICNPKDSISVDELINFFGDLSNYLLIPHYDKNPVIKPETLLKLKKYITSGEVTSTKKFKYCLGDDTSLVPVVFSDQRFYGEIIDFSPRQTFISTEELSLNSIKLCLSDKSKVFLSKENGHKFFQAFSNGQVLSTGLNVILGERSSGKSHTLKHIEKHFTGVKHIKQFELLERDEEKDKEKFNRLLSTRQDNATEEYLKEFKYVIEDIKLIDPVINEKQVEEYLQSLFKVAKEEERKDAFARAKLYYETSFNENNIDNLNKLIDAIKIILENTQYREIIHKHITNSDLVSLIRELMVLHNDTEEDNLKKRWINSIVENIKSDLQARSSSTPICEIDLYEICFDNEKIEKFTQIVKNIQIERTIETKDVKRYTVVAETKKYTGASELRKKLGKRDVSFREAFENYSNPINFLSILKSIDDLPETQYYRYFVNVNYRILNKHGYEVSGGERSEFNLLDKIQDALKYDMLLIDEPESSFDNLFLKNQVNSLIKDISKHIPVVVVTHNSTVGASIKPDYVICTRKEIENDKVVYRIYAGHPSSSKLKSLDGKIITNYEVMLNCLEAGQEAYQNRGKTYEILQD